MRQPGPRQRWFLWAIVCGSAAAVLSPIAEIITGNGVSYLLVLTALSVLTWGLFRLGRQELGLRPGHPGDYLLALVYPAAAMGILAFLAWAADDASPASALSEGSAKKLGLMFASTLIGVLITEDGFYRGTLWGISMRAGWKCRSVLIWTSVAFMAWHIAVPLIEEDFRLPTPQLPIYYGNAVLLGLCWGLLRLASGSLLVACTAHASWNAIAYVLFGYGLKSGALHISRISVFDPERGALGLLVNGLALVLLFVWSRRRGIDLDTPYSRRRAYGYTSSKEV